MKCKNIHVYLFLLIEGTVSNSLDCHFSVNLFESLPEPELGKVLTTSV